MKVYLGNQGDVFFRCARASVSVKGAFEVRFEPVSCRRRQMRRRYLLSYKGNRSIDYPAQGNPYNNRMTTIVVLLFFSGFCVCPYELHKRRITSSVSGRKKITSSRLYLVALCLVIECFSKSIIVRADFFLRCSN